MADTKLSALTAITQADVDDTILLYCVDAVGGNLSRQVTKGNLFAGTKKTQLTLTMPSSPIGSSSPFVGGISIPSNSITFGTAAQTGDYATNQIGQATLIDGTGSGTITNAASLDIIGAPIASTGITFTNNYALRVRAGTTLLQTTTMAGTLTMSSADIALGTNRIKTGNFDIYEAAAAGQDGVNVIPYNGIGGVFSIGTGVGGVTGLQIISTTDITTNYKLLRIDQGLTSGDWTISSVKAGSATLSPINVLMGATKLLSFDTANTITSYVAFSASFASSAISTITPDNTTSAGFYLQQTGTIKWNIISEATTSNFVLLRDGGQEFLRAVQSGFNINYVQHKNGDLVIGGSAISTSATSGFLIIPSCAGAPSGTPTNASLGIPMVYDTVDHRLYIYEGGAWHYIARTA